jgi:hypothetical protein
MKTITKLLTTGSLLGTAAFLIAQNGPPPGRGGPGGPGGQRQPPPIITALDANQDGEISADEIANASAALKKLDKNGDGKLSRDEYMGQRPGERRGPGGPGGGEGRPQRPPSE